MFTLTNDFTFEAYENLLKEFLSKGYAFVNDSEAYRSSGKRIVNRHDVDFYPRNALRMAEIDHSVGIKSSFYFLLDSIYYNPFSDDCLQAVKRIKEMGHSVNLHIDGNKDCDNLIQFEKKLQAQAELWKGIFHFPVESFTFHMNNNFTLNCNEESYAGLFNSGLIPRKLTVTYISDSNGFWGSKPLEKTDFELQDCILLLTHPVWWSDRKLSPYDRFEEFLGVLNEEKRVWYTDVISKCNRPYPGQTNG